MSNTPLLNSDNTSTPEPTKVEINQADANKMNIASACSALASLTLMAICVLSLLGVTHFGWFIGAFGLAALVKNHEALVAERLLKKYTTYDPLQRPTKD